MGEVSLLNEAMEALVIMADFQRIGFLLLGVCIGLILGVIPGLGGLVGLSLLLPFTFDMNPYTALAFLMGLQSVTVTSDTIPAVLFGVPGTVGSAATILDGYPMARKGEAEHDLVWRSDMFLLDSRRRLISHPSITPQRRLTTGGIGDNGQQRLRRNRAGKSDTVITGRSEHGWAAACVAGNWRLRRSLKPRRNTK